jgi:hypothetical protein
MATTAKPLFRGAATTTVGTVLYTTPASTTTVVSNICITNTAATAATFTLGLATVALQTTSTIAANSTIYIDLKQALTATQTITGGASAITVSFHISGVEVS